MPGLKWMIFFFFGCGSLVVDAQKTFPALPDQAFIHTEDISLFWKVFDEAKPGFDGDKFRKYYLEAGSEGLRGFIPMRIQNGRNLSNVIQSNIAYYEKIRASSLQINKMGDTLKRYLEIMESLYPPSVYPEIFFVIGALNSGGTTFGKGLIIGAEMFGNEAPGFKPRLPFSSINLVVIHELVHFQQNLVKDNTLLAQSIREGSADLVCELVTGSHANKYFYSYGDMHEKELWHEFKSQMFETTWGVWLYGGSKDPSRPQDLGYWMGYKIAKAYYDRMNDKKQAISDILNIRDFKLFLEQSGYGQ